MNPSRQTRLAVCIGLGCIACLLAGRFVLEHFPAEPIHRVTMAYTSQEPTTSCLHKAKAHPLEHLRFLIPSMQHESLLQKAMQQGGHQRPLSAFHLRPAYDNHGLFLDLQGPAEQTLPVLRAWQNLLVEHGEKLRQNALREAPPEERACLRARMLHLSPDPSKPKRLPDTPSWNEGAVFLALSFFLGALSWMAPKP